jgi:hypothetical protein
MLCWAAPDGAAVSWAAVDYILMQFANCIGVPVSVVRDIILTFLHAVISPLLHPIQASTLNFISTPHLSAEKTADTVV